MTGDTQIAGIELEGELGRGAHSVVYRARQNGAPCAVKLPHVKARWTRWIYREAVALARVRHPCLPAVLEVGEVGGYPYLVMDLVMGETLAERLTRGPMDEADALTIAGQLVDVLAAVHDAGLVHRDVKPRNVVLGAAPGHSPGSAMALKLVDFGFATPMERVGTADAAGTAAYASPEQLTLPGQVDGRADLYAVGRILFECLTGQRLARRGKDGPWGADARAELMMHGVGAGLASIVAGLLGRRPEDRYVDAHAVRAELERLRVHGSVLGPERYEAGSKSTELVIHADDLGRLVRVCNDESGGAVVVVRAPRGGGKSRLLSAAQVRPRTAATLVAQCRSDDPPLSTLRRILESFRDRALEGGGAASLAVTLGNLAPVANLIVPGLVDGDVPAPALVGADALAEVCAEIIVRLASRRGRAVLFIDDAQWMDPASRDALVRIAHRASEVPVVLVLAARTDVGRELGPFVAGAKERAMVIDLPRLGEEDVRSLVRAHLGEVELPAALVSRVSGVADGTPLGVLEALGAFLDAGALRPHDRSWSFDAAMAQRIALPDGALLRLSTRLEELPTATRRVLELGAVVGRSFEDGFLGRVIGLSEEELGYGLAAARRAGLIEPVERACHRFVHDSVRELLVERLPLADRRRLHQLVAEALDAIEHPSFEEVCSTATHYVAGELTTSPRRAYEVARRAADAALARFDNETALRFQADARTAAEVGGITPDASFYATMGEAHLRLGALPASLAAFEVALSRTSDSTMRAAMLGRIAWVHQMRAAPEEAWTMLERAFVALGATMPRETIRSATQTTAAAGRWKIRQWLGRTATRPRTPSEIDLLCELHYQNARLGLEYGKVARLLQSCFAALELCDDGASRTRARVHAMHGFILTVLRQRGAGAKEIALAKEIASVSADQATFAFCIQIETVMACWAGELDAALTIARECVDTHGAWLELAEYCTNVADAAVILSVRGCSLQAWNWVERALARSRRGRTQVMATHMLHRARASLAAIGGSAEGDPWLAAQFLAVTPKDPGHNYHRFLSWGPRARFYVESGDLEADFEELVRAFEAEAYNPRIVHPVIGEYYVSIVQARLHQCIRARQTDAAGPVEHLRAAAASLARVKIGLVNAHRLLAEAALAWLDGKTHVANELLTQAESVANEQSCPWVLYGVARVRAHMLREVGKEHAARDQARVAEVFAREHGAATRMRWIREEFALPEPSPTLQRSAIAELSRTQSSSRVHRQLSALLQVARAPKRDLKTDQQAAVILSELIESLHAERAAIWFQPEPGVPGATVERHRASESSVSLATESGRGRLLRSVHETGAAWPAADGSMLEDHDGQTFDPQRFVAVPLFLYERAVGALAIERRSEDPPFVEDDRALLALLSHQVPIALEIARLLFEREHLQTSLEQMKRMEAMGQLAGGLAHDFNNMLAAIKVSLDAAHERSTHDPELRVELDIIGDTIQRAAQLTGQLLSFSRHKPLPVGVHDLNQVIVNLAPMLERVAGAQVNVVVKASPAVEAAEFDQGSLEQALVNLLINARDAMPRGGTFTITTKNVVLGDNAALRANLPAGDYVEIEAADSGEGMSAEILSRVFEPFFTTKPAGRGTGLGLAMVYAFARNCGGNIDVSSEPGRGTQFKIYLKRAERERAAPKIRAVRDVAHRGTNGPDTILVVDDDDLVRRSISKILERNGYRVLAASGSTEALDVAKEHGRRIALIILDVLMPGLSGPELGQRLSLLNLRAKMLFVSGYSPGSLQISEARIGAEMLLQKPFSQAVLLERVRQLMPS